MSETYDGMLERLAGLEAAMVLDVASGPGNSTAVLRDLAGGSGYAVPCDVDIDLLAGGAERLRGTGGLLPVCANSDLMPFHDDVFDLVGISNSIHHMENLELTLRDMVRVLEPGGRFFVREWYRDGQTETQMSHVLLHEWWASIDQALGVPHYSTFWRGEILEFLGDLGLEDVSIADHAELDSDPLDPEGLEQVDNAVEVYVRKAVELDGFEGFRARGDRLRRRIHSVGIHAATGLLFLGRKPR